VISLLHQTQKHKIKMKATTIILAAIFSLSLNVLIAGNDGATVNSRTHSLRALAPTTPSEATFEEVNFTSACIDLAPVTPVEAGFQEVVPEMIAEHSNLAPVTPAEADFATEVNQPVPTAVSLAPTTPAFADFNGNF
jgi:hypothetical protein